MATVENAAMQLPIEFHQLWKAAHHLPKQLVVDDHDDCACLPFVSVAIYLQRPLVRLVVYLLLLGHVRLQGYSNWPKLHVLNGTHYAHSFVRMMTYFIVKVLGLIDL